MHILLRHKSDNVYLALVETGWDASSYYTTYIHFSKRHASAFDSVAEAKHWLKHFRLRQRDYEFVQVNS